MDGAPVVVVALASGCAQPIAWTMRERNRLACAVAQTSGRLHRRLRPSVSHGERAGESEGRQVALNKFQEDVWLTRFSRATLAAFPFQARFRPKLASGIQTKINFPLFAAVASSASAATTEQTGAKRNGIQL